VAAVVGDATSAAEVKGFVAAAEKLAPLAVAVHNAGGNDPAPFLKVTEASFTQHWREHALGAFQLAQAALPVLLAHGGGSLFFTGASGSLRGKASFAPFASAKAAVRNLAQSIAREYGPQNIHVGHVIVDGGIEGDRLLARAPSCKRSAVRTDCSNPMRSRRRIGTCTINSAVRGRTSSTFDPGARASRY
jgi:NAD(P)-dependent dehydrogenase (short-subunit alcohol dehydrogenase family)